MKSTTRPSRSTARGFRISVVAERYGIHPQTLRMYEREGLLAPSRSAGNTRLYDESDLQDLEVILHLSRNLGLNRAGVEVVLEMRRTILGLQKDIERLEKILGRESGGAGDRSATLIPVGRRSELPTLPRGEREAGERVPIDSPDP